MFASRLAPFLREVLPEVETLKFGLNRSERHEPIWNGLDMRLCAGSADTRGRRAPCCSGEAHRITVGRVEHEARPIDHRIHRPQIRRDTVDHLR